MVRLLAGVAMFTVADPKPGFGILFRTELLGRR